MAERLRDRPFWFVYTCDFRGRVYCTSTTLSPQGPDHIKGLITFNEGKPLGREGIRWLAINGANKYGYDKVDYNDRVRWVLGQREAIESFVREPLSAESRSFIGGADKPFQFAAFCFEWAACGFGTNPEFVSSLPIGLDGSCNGIQHFSALLRDPRGGRSVNLSPSELPADIYGEVATEFRRLLSERGSDDMAVQILSLHPDRSAAKRPVMTLPYGSTQQSCRQYLFDWIQDKLGRDRDPESRALATYATPILWEAIGNVVVAARAAMAWLQQCSGIVASKGIYARWRSPADFPVYQHYSVRDQVKVETDLFGRITVSIQGSPTGVLKHRARNSVAPNYVHSMDAAHMVFTINEAVTRGITNFAMVHDDFGTLAADTPEFFDLIRVTFVRMYHSRSWLHSWKAELESLGEDLELPDPPEPGDLQILDVLDSQYFFG
jgi:DNA-directed RNA polymerase